MSEEPSDEFRGYLAPLSIEGAPSRIAERWKGVEVWGEDAEPSSIPPLVAAVFGHLSGDALEPLWAAVRKEDESFSLVAQKEAARVIAAATLDYLFTSKPGIDVPAALSVICASFGGRTPEGLAVDIVSRASAEIESIAASARDRTGLAELVDQVAIAPLAVPKSVGLLADDQGYNPAQIRTAMADILKNATAGLTALSKVTRAALSEAEARLRMCDEETELLWFVFNGLSMDRNLPFSRLEAGEASFVVAREIAERSSRPLRRDTLSALLARCDIGKKSIPLAKAVEAVPPSWIAEHVPNSPSALLYPLSRALDRYREIGEAQTWAASWGASTGLDPQMPLRPIDLAAQFYAEQLLMRELT